MNARRRIQPTTPSYGLRAVLVNPEQGWRGHAMASGSWAWEPHAVQVDPLHLVHDGRDDFIGIRGCSRQGDVILINDALRIADLVVVGVAGAVSHTPQGTWAGLDLPHVECRMDQTSWYIADHYEV